MIRNIIIDPQPIDVSAWDTDGRDSYIELRMTSDGSMGYIRNITGISDAYIKTLVTGLEAGEYVYVAYVTASGTMGMSLRVIQRTPPTEIANITHTSGWNICPFTLDHTDNVHLRIQGTKDADTVVNFRYLGLYTAADWARVQAMYQSGDLPLPWFYYDTMPLGGGLSVLCLLAVHMACLAALDLVVAA